MLLTPHIVKMPELERSQSSRSSGRNRNVHSLPRPGPPPGRRSSRSKPNPNWNRRRLYPNRKRALEPVPGEDSLQFDTSALTLERGTPTRLGLRIDTSDMTGADLVIEFDPSSVTLQQVNDGGFLSGDGTSIALVQTIDTERGRAVISLERSNLASAVSGEGEVLSLVLEAVGSGESILRVE